MDWRAAREKTAPNPEESSLLWTRCPYATYGLAFGNRRRGDNVKHLARKWRPDFRNFCPEKIGDPREQLPLVHALAALHMRIQNARGRARQHLHRVEIYRAFERRRPVDQHAQFTHDAEYAIRDLIDALFVRASQIAALHRDGCLAACDRRIRTVDRTSRVGWAAVVNHNVIDAEGQRDALDRPVERRISGHRLVNIRAQRLVAIAAMQIEHAIRAIDHFRSNGMCDAFGDGAIGPAGIATVEVLPIDRAEVHGPPQKRRH